MMIASKQDLQAYIKADRMSLGLSLPRGFFLGGGILHIIRDLIIPNISTFERKMRVLEYYHNCRRDRLGRLIYLFKKVSYERYSRKLGFTIPINVFGPGLCICHVGTIVINGNVRIGANARIHVGVNIGNYARLDKNWQSDNVPIIGNNVYIGPGAKLFGKIFIGNDVAIGANAVVHTNVEDHVTVAGVPARVINTNGSNGLLIKGWK